jgi:hypothetical protein
MSQVNVVVPDEHADLVRRVGRALRETDGFADSLRQFLDADPAIPERLRQTLAQEVAEAVVAAIAPVIAASGSAVPVPQRRAPTLQRQQFKMEI